IIIGPGTEAVAGEGMILTAGGIDSHIHFICPQQIETAIAYAQMGDRNASIPTPQPVHMPPMFASFGSALSATSLT
ncbi:MAG: hypothetical protein J7540_08930, partial [Roseofilum sp. SID2]|nr:hypothetical protein [Roseofilum sp. SID3]MBP0024104.1 hypothetical protein [Roseofilum sp. SID2]MBP0038864.1 hypothetical protein [Roseofilum sp. SID1]